MEATPSRALEITVLSADNLRVDRNPVTNNNVFVVVRTSESIASFATSMASTEGDHSHFSWNEKLVVDIPKHARSVTFEVKSKTAMGVVKNVGVARIAASALVGEDGGGVPENCSQLLSYRLRDWEGRKNGVINFAVKLLRYSSSSMAKSAQVTTREKVSSCGFQSMRTSLEQKNRNGVVVIGVPLCWNNYTRHF